MTLGEAEPISRVIVIAGPSGAGKGTIISEVLKRVPGLCLSISDTTRPCRSGRETHAHEYHFLSEADFQKGIDEGAYLEWACYCGHLYGTSAERVRAGLAAGQDVLLEIELEGAKQVLAKCPAAVMVFIMPPSLAELERRLRGRGTESEESIRRRLASAQEEITAVSTGTWAGSRPFDYVILNDNVSRAAEELAHIIERIREEDEQADRR